MKDRYGDPIRVGWSDRLGLALTLWSQLHASRAIGKFCRRMSYRSSSLSPVPRHKGCSLAKYRALAAQEAQRAGVDFRDVMGRTNRRPVARVRWRVWKGMRAMGSSLPAIGKVAGRHHTTIMHGLRGLAKIESERKARIVIASLPCGQIVHALTGAPAGE